MFVFVDLKVIFLKNTKMKTSVLSTFATAMTTIINKIQTAGKKAKTKRNSTKKRELYKD